MTFVATGADFSLDLMGFERDQYDRAARSRENDRPT